MPKVSIPEDVLFEVLDGEAVLLNVATGAYFGLNPSATRMWQLLEELQDTTRMRDRMLEEFEVEPSELARDIEAFLDEMSRRGLLVVASEASDAR